MKYYQNINRERLWSLVFGFDDSDRELRARLIFGSARWRLSPVVKGSATSQPVSHRRAAPSAPNTLHLGRRGWGSVVSRHVVTVRKTILVWHAPQRLSESGIPPSPLTLCTSHRAHPHPRQVDPVTLRPSTDASCTAAGGDRWLVTGGVKVAKHAVCY